MLTGRAVSVEEKVEFTFGEQSLFKEIFGRSLSPRMEVLSFWGFTYDILRHFKATCQYCV